MRHATTVTMIISASSRPRALTIAAALITLVVIWQSFYGIPLTSLSHPITYGWRGSGVDSAARGKKVAHGSLPHVEKYFEQAFGVAHPPPYNLAALEAACRVTKPVDENLYVKCGGMAAGLTSIVSQLKVCLKMAVDTGSSLVLPAMPLRDSKDLGNFNFLNGDEYYTYDKWFDADHLKETIERACPGMKVIHPDELDKTVAVKNKFAVGCGDAKDYVQFKSLFWSGRPYRNYFEEKYREQKEKAAAAAAAEPGGAATPPKEGINLVDIDSQFLLFRITDDPTGQDLRLWNDFDRVIRYLESPRTIVDRLRGKMTRPHYGVHFRVESDNMWSSLEHQLALDLDGLDRAWAMQGRPEPKPLVYLACGDAEQMQKFITAGAERGWEVTHKWKLAEGDAETTGMINALAFDFMGAVDLGVMVQSEFFLGITGSAFSSTIAALRDPTGRYRGSSFDVLDDAGSRSHLFYDLDGREYSCCL